MKFKNILWVLFISMLPIVELRGAIPVGAGLGLPFYINYACAIIGNMLPVPFILLFIPKILNWLGKFKFFAPIVNWLHGKAKKNKSKIVKAEIEVDGEKTEAEVVSNEAGHRKMSWGTFVALMLFVMIPLPGTGAWTGSLVASLFDLPKGKSLLAVFIGVLGSGVIMCLASYGVVGFLKIFI